MTMYFLLVTMTDKDPTPSKRGWGEISDIQEGPCWLHTGSLCWWHLFWGLGLSVLGLYRNGGLGEEGGDVSLGEKGRIQE